MVDESMTPIPQDYCMWLIILRSHTHSREASYRATISELFVDVVTKVCLDDFHEMVVSLCKNTKPVCDLPLWGSDKYHASVYPIMLEFRPLL
jgi:hypothetical protein